MRYHVRIRKFLNRIGHESGAYVIAEVPDSGTCHGRNCVHHEFGECRDLVLKIADCRHVVTLDFSVETAAERRNSRHKINTLINALEQFRTGLDIEIEQASLAPRRV